jgi:hypothetical protein
MSLAVLETRVIELNKVRTRCLFLKNPCLTLFGVGFSQIWDSEDWDSSQREPWTQRFRPLDAGLGKLNLNL